MIKDYFPASFEAFFLDSILNDNNIEISISTQNNKCVTYCEKTHRITDEKYLLKITANEKNQQSLLNAQATKVRFMPFAI